jgi:hypothetical protein
LTCRHSSVRVRALFASGSGTSIAIHVASFPGAPIEQKHSEHNQSYIVGSCGVKDSPFWIFTLRSTESSPNPHGAVLLLLRVRWCTGPFAWRPSPVPSLQPAPQRARLGSTSTQLSRIHATSWRWREIGVKVVISVYVRSHSDSCIDIQHK